MHTNRLFLFASFVIVRSFFRLFAQYDYHINQCNTSLLNKHRIIYKIMRASLMQQDGHDTDRTQRHSTTATATDSTDHTRTAMHHSRTVAHETETHTHKRKEQADDGLLLCVCVCVCVCVDRKSVV